MAAEQHDATTDFNEALKAAFDDGKYDELAGFYTEDSVLLPPRGRMIEGRGSVSAFWRGVKTRFAGMVFTTTGLKQLGDATRRETGTYTTTAADGSASAADGKYVFIWQLVEDEWQIESSIWNRSSGPGQGQGRLGQGGGQRRGGQAGGPGGGQRRQGAGGQGQGYRSGGGGGYRQGGQGAGGSGQGGYRQGGRPSFQGGGGIGGGPRRGGGGQRRGGGPAGGQGGSGSPYEQSGGLYSDLKE